MGFAPQGLALGAAPAALGKRQLTLASATPMISRIKLLVAVALIAMSAVPSMRGA